MFCRVQFLDHYFFWFILMIFAVISSTYVKLFPDNTSLFSIVNDANKSLENLSNDLCILSNWGYQRKMSFKQDRSKQAQEVIFPRNSLKVPRRYSITNTLKVPTVKMMIKVCFH